MQFTPEERASIRSNLLTLARQDERIASGAITGSAASGREDDWSDVDLAFGIQNGISVEEVLSDWTVCMYDRNAAVHHVDTPFGNWFYRTFLLVNTLQVDLAFVASEHFQALGPSFKVVFGAAREPAHFERPLSAQAQVACLAAIYSANACISSSALWRADYFLGVARDNALVSECLNQGLPYHHGRGFDLLPAEIKTSYENAFATVLNEDELSRALSVISATMDDSANVPACTLPELVGVNRGVGLAWLYALHARSCLRRNKIWQAEYMIRGLRDYTFGLACLQSGGTPGLPLCPEPLPEQIEDCFRNTRLRTFDEDELRRVFRLLIELLSSEISLSDVPEAGRLQQTVSALV